MAIPEDRSGPAREGQGGGRGACPCAYCGADTHEDVVKAAFWGPQGWVVIEAIPARVCDGCGEQFYDDTTARRIEGIVNGSTAVPVQRITVPVFSLAGGDAPCVRPPSRGST